MPPTVESIISDILQREGPYSDHPNDRGGKTAWGISIKSHPEAWKDGPPTRDQARQIYLHWYVQRPGFDQISDPHLVAQLVDFAVHSGPQLASVKLQHVLGVEEDGLIGPETLGALLGRSSRDVSNAVAVERIKMIGRIIARDKFQAVWAAGWLKRATEFIR